MGLDINKIETLIEKYLEGETSIEEERILKDYFSNSQDIPFHLATYKHQFSFFKESKKEQNNLKEATNDHLMAVLREKEQFKESVPSIQKIIPKNRFYWMGSIAASLVLFVCGYFIGKTNVVADNKPSGQTELSQVQDEMRELKQIVMLNMLKQNSPSERIKGVNYSYEMEEADPKIIEALVQTLNEDENTNVRLAAANALFALKDDPKVKTALIASLKNQDDPVIQISLINMMIAMKEKKAKKHIEEFLNNEHIPPKVKEKIRENLKDI